MQVPPKQWLQLDAWSHSLLDEQPRAPQDMGTTLSDAAGVEWASVQAATEIMSAKMERMSTSWCLYDRHGLRIKAGELVDLDAQILQLAF